jgi:hypothetical protein
MPSCAGAFGLDAVTKKLKGSLPEVDAWRETSLSADCPRDCRRLTGVVFIAFRVMAISGSSGKGRVDSLAF